MIKPFVVVCTGMLTLLSGLLGETAPSEMSATQALQELRAGNQRFATGKPKHPHEELDWRVALEEGQHPFAVILGCSDSRVPPELVFDQGLGDLFVIRVAGNVVDTDVIASIEYAIDHLGTKLIVVMGHTQCGAVTATLDLLAHPKGEPAEVVSLLHQIEPAVVGLPQEKSRKEQINLAVKRNAELAVRRLTRVPDLAHRMREGGLQIVSALYDMHTGKIEFPK